MVTTASISYTEEISDMAANFNYYQVYWITVVDTPKHQTIFINQRLDEINIRFQSWNFTHSLYDKDVWCSKTEKIHEFQGSSRHYMNLQTGELRISMVTEEDRGEYYCIANTTGQKLVESLPARLRVKSEEKKDIDYSFLLFI